MRKSARSCSRCILLGAGRVVMDGAAARASRPDRALARRRSASHEDSQTAGPAGYRDCVSDAASIRGPRAAVWQTATTIPVLDGEPGQELQLDTGWVGWLTLTERKRRRFAWIFTAVRSRHRFVYPTFEETTARAIEACDAAWDFFGGVFKVIIPDNTKAIIIDADPLAPRITPAFRVRAGAPLSHRSRARAACPRQRARRAGRPGRPRRLLCRRG